MPSSKLSPGEGERAGAERVSREWQGLRLPCLWPDSDQACSYPLLLANYWSFHSLFLPKGEKLVSGDLHPPHNGRKTFLNLKGREGEKMNKDAKEKWGYAEAERKGKPRRRQEEKGTERQSQRENNERRPNSKNRMVAYRALHVPLGHPVTQLWVGRTGQILPPV